MYITVTMTEKATYENTLTHEEFAELVGCEPTEEAVQAVLDADNSDYDFGIEGAEPLLDNLLENFSFSENREWEFS